MSILMLPAVLGLIAKLGLIAWAGNRGQFNRCWLGFVLVLALHNLTEILIFLGVYAGGSAEWIVRCYYVCVAIVLVYSLMFITEGSEYSAVRIIMRGATAVAMLLIATVLFTDLIVSGFVQLNDAVTSVQGIFYPVFQGFVIVTAFCTLWFAVMHFRRAATAQKQITTFYKLIALTPLILVTVIIAVLMTLGFKVNALTFIPIASTLFLFITYFGVGPAEVFKADPRSILPGLPEYTLSREIAQIKAAYAIGNASHQEARDSFEKALINYKIEKFDGNASQTAKSIGMSRSTLYSKATKLGISWVKK